MAEIMG